MGLNSKQVSSNGPPGWSQSLVPKSSIIKKQLPQNQQQNQTQDEPLKCPRCDSSNTKFCYYNNYNKSQPRYSCKACKRHWTKGGTLRNVPIGGGRKNHRHKATSTIGSTSKTSTATSTIGKTRGLEFPFSSSFESSRMNGDATKDPTITSGSSVSQIWQVRFNTSCGNDMDMDMDMENYWNLDDMDALLLNIPWDDSEIKLP